MGNQRLESLDVFRGLTIAAMILVSTPGSWDAVYAPLNHAAWNGWTPTDLVFPFLLFAMGAAVPFALARRRGTHRRVGPHVIRRALILFAIGLVLNAIETSPPSLATFRIPGVLQRIAAVFAIVAVLTERTTWRAQVAVAIGALLGYWALMARVPVPGVGAGILTPEGNLAGYVDRAIFGQHLSSPLGDPEGLLSTIPAVATALAGVFAGDWLSRPGETGRRTIVLCAAGVIAVAIGLAWDRAFPVNKNLWTSSFAMFSAGLAAIVLAAAHWGLDVKGWRAWAMPLHAFGRNPLAGYAGSVALDAALTQWTIQDASIKSAIYQHAFASWITPLAGAEAASLAYALAYVALWGMVLGVMYRRRVFVGI